MPFQEFSIAGLMLSYFLVPLLFFISICGSVRISLESREDSSTSKI